MILFQYKKNQKNKNKQIENIVTQMINTKLDFNSKEQVFPNIVPHIPT